MIVNTPVSAFIIGCLILTKIGAFLLLLLTHIWFNINIPLLNQDLFCVLNSSSDAIWHRVLQGLSFGLLFMAAWTIIKIYRATVLQLNQFKKQRISPENMPVQLQRLVNKYQLFDKLYYINSDQWIALTIGLIRPRILISRAMVNKIDDSELEAVLLHEMYHRRMRDPLLLLIVYTLTKMLFFVPRVKRLHHAFVTWKEIRADYYARTQMKTKKPLISALIKMIQTGNTETINNGHVFASSFKDGGLNLRLAYLLDHKQYINKHQMQIPLRSIIFLTLYTGTLTVMTCV